MSTYICSGCGYVGDYYDFVDDYFWSEGDNDEVAVIVCPKCGKHDSIDETEK